MRLSFHLSSVDEAIRDRMGVEVVGLNEALARVRRAIDEFRGENTSAAQERSGWTLTLAGRGGAFRLALELDRQSSRLS